MKARKLTVLVDLLFILLLIGLLSACGHRRERVQENSLSTNEVDKATFITENVDDESEEGQDVTPQTESDSETVPAQDPTRIIMIPKEELSEPQKFTAVSSSTNDGEGEVSGQGLR